MGRTTSASSLNCGHNEEGRRKKEEGRRTTSASSLNCGHKKADTTAVYSARGGRGCYNANVWGCYCVIVCVLLEHSHFHVPPPLYPVYFFPRLPHSPSPPTPSLYTPVISLISLPSMERARE